MKFLRDCKAKQLKEMDTRRAPTETSRQMPSSLACQNTLFRNALQGSNIREHDP